MANITEIDGTAKSTQKGTKQKKEEEPRRIFAARVRQEGRGKERENERTSPSGGYANAVANALGLL